MINEEFYSQPETIEFIKKTEAKLADFKQKSAESQIENVVNINTAQKANADELENKRNMLKKIEEYTEKQSEYDKKAAKATKKVYSENYRKPPKAYQFKKDHSGNLKGRPPKLRAFTLQDAIFKAFYQEVEIKQENGKTQKKSFIELLGETIVRDAIKKDGPSRRMLLQDNKFLNHNFMKPLINEVLNGLSSGFDNEGFEKLKKDLRELVIKDLDKRLEDEAS